MILLLFSFHKQIGFHKQLCLLWNWIQIYCIIMSAKRFHIKISYPVFCYPFLHLVDKFNSQFIVKSMSNAISLQIDLLK